MLLLALLAGGCGQRASERLEDHRAEVRLESGTDAGPAEPTPSVPEPGPPATAAPLALLATMVSDDPRGGRASLRDRESGVVATYRVGDPVHLGLVLAAVDEDAVLLQREGGGLERLGFAEHPATLAAGDVFYPDLALDDLGPSSMADAIAMTPGPGWIVKTPAHAWGTPKTIAVLTQALRRYVTTQGGGPEIRVGDLSLPRGGPFPPHVSHQSGRDVDVGYVLRGTSADTVRFVSANRDNLDRARTWALLDAFLQTGHVAYIFMDHDLQRLLYEHALGEGRSVEELRRIFQYPKGPRAMHGIIRHWPGHVGHFHVRFER